ncbi:hypothetical protein [Nitrososphaera sp. AFS]|uniref:hypothetical protein n=1 Tax=Nitrososphaera sp. AFS TaxID=2301191 RepID=UPI00139246FB|nr:hypothetical protein [Nitrososphaera sp. AFS]NAL78833.1 hypothetical protein [Nitrososphaera sp. AFS]
MSDREETVIRYNARKFLLEACRIAMGDITKSIKVNEIWKKAGISAISEDAYAPKIIQILKGENLIQGGNHKDEIKITYDGIYSISDSERIPPESLGVISKQDIDRFLPRFLDILYNETKGDPAKSISIFEIKKKGLNALGPEPIRQISDVLKRRGWVADGDNKDEIKIAKVKF